MSRRTDNWLESWLEYSSSWESPERFRLWSGVAAISAALQRRAWTFVRGQRLFPNTYILLVGPPGVGKGNAMKYLAQWLKELDEVEMAPDGLTKRAFYAVLEAAKAFPSSGDNVYLDETHHSLAAFIEELGVFLHAGDNDFIYTLCHVFDCPEQFHYKTFSQNENQMEKVCFSMLSACTPKGLRDIFTEEAMELGISARTILVFSDDKVQVDIFGRPAKHERLEKDLRTDLQTIARLPCGEYQFDEDGAQELVQWSKTNFAPMPKDPRFEHYNSRRFIQIVKLCMICAASKRDDPIILKSDVEDARKYLLEAEEAMPNAIATLGANPVLAQQNAALKLINLNWEKLNRGTPESEVLRSISRDVPPHIQGFLTDALEHAKWVRTVGSKPERIFFPRGKGPEEDKK